MFSREYQYGHMEDNWPKYQRAERLFAPKTLFFLHLTSTSNSEPVFWFHFVTPIEHIIELRRPSRP